MKPSPALADRLDDITDPQNLTLQELLAENNALRQELSDLKAASSLKTTQYSSLLENLPMGTQEEDYSKAKVMIDKLKVDGVTDLQSYLNANPSFVKELVNNIFVINVNPAMVEMYGAENKEQCIAEEEDLEEWWDDHWVEFYAREFDLLAGSNASFKTERLDTKSDGSPFITNSVSFLAEGCEDSWDSVITIHEDITQRKLLEVELRDSHDQLENNVRERTQELRESEQRFRDFSKSGSDWFWEMDDDFRYSYLSEDLEKHSGFRPSDLIGKSRFDLGIQGATEEAIKEHFELLEAHKPFRDFVYYIENKITKLWISISGQPIFDEQGNFTGYRGTGRNVSQQIELEKNLENAMKQALAANVAKSQFLATMSHELRTPMTGVLGFSDLLLDDDLPNNSAEKVMRIKDSANSLLHLLNDILDMSKIDAGKMDIEKIDFDLHRLINETVTQINKSRTSDTAPALKIDFSSDFPKDINSDPTRIRQILVNLVGNAVKFTEKGQICIRGEMIVDDDNLQRLKLSVEDTGIGMSPATMAKLFSEFTQADASISRRYEGSGLGLAICKRLVTLLEGDIDVESTSGKGSTFWITLPFRQVSAQISASAEESLDTNYATRKKLRILFAEDNRVNQLVIKKSIEKYGHHVTIAENGLKALDIFHKAEFDLILMDVRMPEMDGLDATRAIRKLKGSKSRIPIIAVTADAMKDSIGEYTEAGMNGFVSKPINRIDLVTTINQVMGEEIHVAGSLN